MASWKQSGTTFPSSRSSMRISVSTLPFCGLATSQLEHLPPDIGIELLCECGNDYFWDSQMEVCMRHRSGPLTVHAPFLHMNLASPDLMRVWFRISPGPFNWRPAITPAIWLSIQEERYCPVRTPRWPGRCPFGGWNCCPTYPRASKYLSVSRISVPPSPARSCIRWRNT